ncbi:MAG: chromatin-remodeling complex subunit snf22 complex subunit snf22 [Firmicutes bacterium]|nr:chromatin-remodeling complex subunit snf22 complex subunit snf22 [Bacillota bacterium]
MPSRDQLHSYQNYTVQRIIDNPAFLLLLGLGMGKTISTLTAITELLHNYFEIAKVLVIAPLRVAKYTWATEAAKWDHTKYLTIAKVLGPEKQRLVALKSNADIYVINRENVPWLVELYGSAWPFDMVAIDESSSFKSHKAHRFKALRKVRPLVKRIVELTGTPAPNNLLDLWPQIYLLDRGERLGRTITGFRERYFNPGKRDGHIVFNWELKADADKAIYSKIDDICVSMKAKDWLTLPERINNVIKIPLSDPVKKMYKQMERDLLLPHVEGDIVANTAAVLSNKLLQMANGAAYDEHGAVRILHNAKLEALEDIIEAANGNPVLVFYWYKHDIERIRKQFPEARTLDKTEDMEDWNAGKIPLLLAHPASAGHGLNLQAGGNIIVWFGLTWSLELYEQANARLDRQGQTKSVIVHHLVAEGTIDEKVMLAIENKACGQNALMEAVKARIREIGGGGLVGNGICN